MGLSHGEYLMEHISRGSRMEISHRRLKKDTAEGKLGKYKYTRWRDNGAEVSVQKSMNSDQFSKVLLPAFPSDRTIWECSFENIPMF